MDFTKEYIIETYRSLITVSMEGLKTLLLINGGAVVAVLAYLGQAERGPELAPHAWLPLAFFVAGIFLCSLAFWGSYSTQFALLNEKVNSDQYNGPPHMKCLIRTLILVVLSLICFAGGSFFMISII